MIKMAQLEDIRNLLIKVKLLLGFYEYRNLGMTK